LFLRYALRKHKFQQVLVHFIRLVALNPMDSFGEKEKSAFITKVHAWARQTVTRLLCISQYRRLQKCVSIRRRAGQDESTWGECQIWRGG